MPVVLKKITRQYEVVCDACEALIGFTAEEVTEKTVSYFDDHTIVKFVKCPNCKNNIRLADNYKKKLKSTEV